MTWKELVKAIENSDNSVMVFTRVNEKDIMCFPVNKYVALALVKSHVRIQQDEGTFDANENIFAFYKDGIIHIGLNGEKK